MKRLLVYVLDVPATLSQNQVVIDLARRQRRPSGDWGPLKPWWHSPGSAQAKYDLDDRELLNMLDEAQTPSASAAAAAALSPLAAATARKRLHTSPIPAETAVNLRASAPPREPPAISDTAQIDLLDTALNRMPRGFTVRLGAGLPQGTEAPK